MSKVNKEILIIAIVLILIGVTFTYLSIAFVFIEFNPFNWREDQRMLFLFIAYLIIFLSIPISGIIQLDND